MKLFLALAFVGAAFCWEDLGSWTDDSWKVEDGKIKVRMPKAEGDATKLKEAPKIQWWPTSNTKSAGAKSYTMLQDKDKDYYLVFSKKEMKGQQVPDKDDEVAAFKYDQKSMSLERDEDDKEFVSFDLVQVNKPEAAEQAKKEEKKEEASKEKKEETPKAAKKTEKKAAKKTEKKAAKKEDKKEEKAAMSLEREEKFFPFFFPFAPLMAAAGPFAMASFAFGPHMLAAAATGTTALERESVNLEREVAVEQGLERERFFPGPWGVFPWMAMGPWGPAGAAMMLPAAMAGF